MKFDYSKASGVFDSREIELESVDELLDFIKREGNSVVISEPPIAGRLWGIILYDDYME
jgi:hypothetical protein